jgi:hypothetical protein
MLITVQTILDLQPCSKYSRERLAEIIPSADAAADAYAAEHRLACEHALALLGGLS